MSDVTNTPDDQEPTPSVDPSEIPNPNGLPVDPTDAPDTDEGDEGDEGGEGDEGDETDSATV